jgi:uncharacterized membrane protein
MFSKSDGTLMAPDDPPDQPTTDPPHDTSRGAHETAREAKAPQQSLDAHLEHLLEPARHALHAAEEHLEPAWRRVTRGEPRLPVSLAVLATLAIELLLPARVANHPRWLLAGLAAVLLIGIVAANPKRIDRPSRRLRAASLLLIAVLSAANLASIARLIIDLINAQGIRDPATLLSTGGAIWLTNIIVFSLWYWELDRGGPVARAVAPGLYPDFLFPQMANPEIAPVHWEPTFVDYLYTAFTNATAFSPTDVMPMSRWAKLAMMLQTAISLSVVVLVIARAVNILQ